MVRFKVYWNRGEKITWHTGRAIDICGFPCVLFKAHGMWRVSEKITGCCINKKNPDINAVSSDRKEAIRIAKDILKDVTPKVWKRKIRERKRIAEQLYSKAHEEKRKNKGFGIV